jgi:hypothetical protein
VTENFSGIILWEKQAVSPRRPGLCRSLVGGGGLVARRMTFKARFEPPENVAVSGMDKDILDQANRFLMALVGKITLLS